MSRKEILLSGAGGQGVLFFGTMLSLIAAQKGKRAVATSSYGAAMRGGEVKCAIVIADEEIHDLIVDEADIVVALNEASLKKYGPKVKEGGVLICEDSEKTKAIVSTFNKQFELVSVPLRGLGPERYHNMVAMGILSQIDPNFDIELIRKALTKELKKKGKESVVEENLTAVKSGCDWYIGEKSKK